MRQRRMNALVAALCLFSMCVLGMSISAEPAHANSKETPTMTESQQQPDAPVHSQLQLENKTEHVLHIALAGGDVVTVPPTVEGAKHTIKFADAEERARFEQATQTETVQIWIRNGDLTLHGGSSPQSSSPPLDPAPQAPSGAQPHDSAGAPTSPASKRGRGDRE